MDSAEASVHIPYRSVDRPETRVDIYKSRISLKGVLLVRSYMENGGVRPICYYLNLSSSHQIMGYARSSCSQSVYQKSIGESGTCCCCCRGVNKNLVHGAQSCGQVCIHGVEQSNSVCVAYIQGAEYKSVYVIARIETINENSMCRFPDLNN